MHWVQVPAVGIAALAVANAVSATVQPKAHAAVPPAFSQVPGATRCTEVGTSARLPAHGFELVQAVNGLHVRVFSWF